MLKAVRFKLRYGPYRAPAFRIGGTLRDRSAGKVCVVRVTDARIPWPVTKRGSLILCGDLARAVRLESNQAVAFWWGVSGQSVTKWRKALGVGPTTKGTRALRSEHFNEPWGRRARRLAWAKARDPDRRAKIAASRLGKKRPPHVIEAMRQVRLGKPLGLTTRRKMSATHKARGTRPPWPNPPWSAEHDRLALTLSIREAAEQTGRTVSAVVNRRHALKHPNG